jgi:uncharacterized protein (UPF0332 family)
VKEEVRTLIQYRMERAWETLDEAAVMLERHHTNAAVNRLYYACFYAVNALLLTRNLTSGKHTGVRALFHQHFIKSNEFSQEIGKFYDRLFDNRQKGDYEDFVRFQAEDIQLWLAQGRDFVATIAQHVEMQIGE